MESTNFEKLTLSLRVGGYCFVVFFLFLIWFKTSKKNVKYSFTFLAICLAGYLFLYVVPNWLFASFYLVNLLLPIAMSLLVSSIFGDRLYRRIHGVAAGIICIAWLFYVQSDPPFQGARVIAFVTNAMLSIFALRNAWLNFKDDLNDRRKHRRLALGTVVLVYIVGVALVSLLLKWDSSVRDILRLGEGVVLLMAIFALNLLSIDAVFGGPFFRVDPDTTPSVLDLSKPSTQTVQLVQPQDEEKILQFMDVSKPYLEPRLTLDALSTAIGLPQHRVRIVLNHRLGYENFNDFVNYYRVEHAARLLSTPDGAKEKVFAVALQSGFSSLAPFNRAFKKRFGVPPSEYRSSRQADNGSNLGK